MPLEKTDSIDVIGIDRNSVVLSVIDSHDWSGESKHLSLLTEKLNTYLRFIESGEIDEAYPKGRGLRRTINIICQHEPSKLGLEFIGNAKKSIEAAGIDFLFEVRS